MMQDRVPVGGRLYFFFLMLLLLSRGADFLSTWIATPNMVLEGNPLARKLGWKWDCPPGPCSAWRSTCSKNPLPEHGPGGQSAGQKTWLEMGFLPQPGPLRDVCR